MNYRLFWALRAAYAWTMKRVVYQKQAQKVLRRLSPKLSKQIRRKIDDHAAGRLVDVTRLSGRGEYVRIRCGSWRVIVEESEAVVDVVKIAPRGDADKGS